MDRKDKIAIAVTIALVAAIGGCVLAADDHGQVGAYYYLNLASVFCFNPAPGVSDATIAIKRSHHAWRNDAKSP